MVDWNKREVGPHLGGLGGGEQVSGNGQTEHLAPLDGPAGGEVAGGHRVVAELVAGRHAAHPVLRSAVLRRGLACRRGQTEH